MLILMESKPIRLIVVAAAFVIICVAAVFFFMKPFASGRLIEQSKFSLDYTVTAADPAVKILDVAVTMTIHELSEEKMIYLYRGQVDSPNLSCTDDAGAAVGFRDSGGFIAIGPLGESIQTVRLAYAVRVGQEQTDQYDGVPYVLGDLYDDLLVFSGENVLIVPMTDSSEITETEKYISRVSFRLAADQDWQSIMPYQSPLDETRSFSIENPTWGVFNNISKSAFCFGAFETVPVESAAGQPSAFYIDKACADTSDEAALAALAALTDFYTAVFGGGLSDRPFVLLRNSAENDAIILGGVGGQTGAMSVNLRLAKDCEVLSRTLFHAFFDSKVQAPNLRYAKNDWLYTGLADYYVAVSADFLPQSVMEAFSVSKQDSMALKYLRYLYFSLKEPGFLVLSPANETEMYAAQQEYYMSTKVPLMIDFINYTVWQREGIGDGLVKALTEDAGTEEPVDIDRLIADLCGTEKEAVGRYFSGAALLPNYNALRLDDLLTADEVTAELAAYEQLFTTLFSNQNISYLPEQPLLLNEEKLMAEAEARGAHYNTTEIEAVVKDFSSVLHRLLTQYALRAQLAGIDDITETNIKGALYTDEATAAWSAFCDTVGYESAIPAAY